MRDDRARPARRRPAARSRSRRPSAACSPASASPGPAGCGCGCRGCCPESPDPPQMRFAPAVDGSRVLALVVIERAADAAAFTGVRRAGAGRRREQARDRAPQPGPRRGAAGHPRRPAEDQRRAAGVAGADRGGGDGGASADRTRPARRRPAAPRRARGRAPPAARQLATRLARPRAARRARRRCAGGRRRAAQPRARHLPAAAARRGAGRGDARGGGSQPGRRDGRRRPAGARSAGTGGRGGGRVLLLPRGAAERGQARPARRGPRSVSTRRRACCPSPSPTTGPASIRRPPCAARACRTWPTGSAPSAAPCRSGRRQAEAPRCAVGSRWRGRGLNPPRRGWAERWRGRPTRRAGSCAENVAIAMLSAHGPCAPSPLRSAAPVGGRSCCSGCCSGWSRASCWARRRSASARRAPTTASPTPSASTTCGCRCPSTSRGSPRPCRRCRTCAERGWRTAGWCGSRARRCASPRSARARTSRRTWCTRCSSRAEHRRRTPPTRS